MAYLTKAPRGTADVLPDESYKLRFIEKTVGDAAELFGFKEIRTPVFEHTELFQRGIGDTTDVVQKEMYTFEDKGNRSITLRPEGTAGAVRAFLEHGLFNEPLPQKYYYLTSCYRYEKPQSGRLREFHQFGVETFGSETPAQDAEVIALAKHIFDIFDLTNISLEINSIGCPECRGTFQKALKEYFEARKNELCETCLGRLERNPMRILDCKSPVCSEIASGAPKVLDYLCGECDTHFASVQKYLRAMDIPFTVNPTIVRGLDYYTKTVFEFLSSSLGAQSAVCAGGRYDGLVSELGGNPTPACGFGMGIERLKMILEAEGKVLLEDEKPDLYIAPANSDYSFEAMRITDALRKEGVSVLTDVSGRSLKAQMKFADKKKAMFTMVLGEDEIKTGKLKVKNMNTGETAELELNNITESFSKLLITTKLTGDVNSEKSILNLTLLDGGKK
ncbi:MAG: histidine--tRNA ligase [Oscillospiraceae bacterium]|nr:histidine--tRNA ligase [Oscillospiraceae bacterium]